MKFVFLILGAAVGLWLLRRQMFGDPAPVDDGWRDLEQADYV